MKYILILLAFIAIVVGCTKDVTVSHYYSSKFVTVDSITHFDSGYRFKITVDDSLHLDHLYLINENANAVVWDVEAPSGKYDAYDTTFRFDHNDSIQYHFTGFYHNSIDVVIQPTFKVR